MAARPLSAAVAASALVAAAIGCCPDPRAPSLARDGSLPGLDWLSGSWATENGSTEEHWTTPRGGSMLGVGRLVLAGRTLGYEHLRIAQDGGQIVYHASPKGQPPAAFKLVERTDKRLVFEDPDHDYPQRIVYERVDDDHVVARIEGIKNGKREVQSWPLRRVARAW